jgi:hypothetical protein
VRSLAFAVLLTLALLPSSAHAQTPASFELTLEPTTATVGDRLTLTITATHAQDDRIDAPENPVTFGSLDVLDIRRPVTVDAGDGLQETRFVYVVAAFKTGFLEAEPVEVAAFVDGREQRATLDVAAVTIESVLPDGEPEVRDLAGPLAPPPGPSGWWLWATLSSAAFVGLSIVTIVLARAAVTRRPPGRREAPQPPDATARAALDALDASGLIERGDYLAYYRQLASVLRRYLSERYHIPASALTPDELAARLDQAGVDRWPARLAENILRQCDAVLFARYEPARERAEADLASAYEVLELTAEPPQPAAARQQQAATP